RRPRRRSRAGLRQGRQGTDRADGAPGARGARRLAGSGRAPGVRARPVGAAGRRRSHLPEPAGWPAVPPRGVGHRPRLWVAGLVVAGANPAPPRPVVAAALLHDCGKSEAGLGTFERVGATVWITVVGRAHAGTGDGRIARYTRHEPIGAELLRAAGSDPVTVA